MRPTIRAGICACLFFFQLRYGSFRAPPRRNIPARHPCRRSPRFPSLCPFVARHGPFPFDAPPAPRIARHPGPLHFPIAAPRLSPFPNHSVSASRPFEPYTAALLFSFFEFVLLFLFATVCFIFVPVRYGSFGLPPPISLSLYTYRGKKKEKRPKACMAHGTIQRTIPNWYGSNAHMRRSPRLANGENPGRVPGKSRKINRLTAPASFGILIP